jgi:hypothetical protein
MKALLIRFIPPGTDGDCIFGLAEISVNATLLRVQNFFGAERVSGRVALELEIRPDFYGFHESWEQVFSGNPHGQMSLVPLAGVSYRCFGRIISINPLVADCGLLTLEVPLTSNDSRVVGEFVGFTAHALAAYW